MNSFQERCENFSKQCAVFLSFTIPISTVGTHIVLFVLMMSWFLSGHFREKSNYIIKHPVARVALLLFSIFLLGTTYSNASLENIIQLLDKMSKLLYLPFLLPLMTDEKWRKKAIWAFLSAMILTLVLSLLKVYGGLPISSRYTMACIFKDHIYTNLMMAFASFIIAHYAMDKPTFRSRFILLCVLATLIFYIFFMSEGRSGYIIFILLAIVLSLQRYRLRGLCLSVLGISLIVGLAYWASEPFQRRITAAVDNLEQYWKENDKESSLGSRLEFSYRTLELSKQHPWLGWGTGSFKQVYEDHTNPHDLLTKNPHNEYLNILVQVGLFGLCVFLGFFWTIFKRSFYLPKPERWFAQGLLFSMVAGCFANSWLMDSTAGYFFIVLMACCFGALKLKDT